MPGCGKKPLLDELSTNRLKVIIKGTYESNNPKNWDAANNFTRDDNSIITGTTGACTEQPPLPPTQFMLDIAELKLDDKKFANYRQLITADINDIDPFFNGAGVVYNQNDDPGSGDYINLQVYIRKMVFNSGTYYYLNSDTGNEWAYNAPSTTMFHEESINGFDFNQFQTNTYFDSLMLEADTINRVFPLVVPINGGFNYDNNNDETVLEIRLVIKNFTKKYEYVVPNTATYLFHYFALSDWLRDVQRDETSMGGNVLAVARSYVPGKTFTLTKTDITAANTYVIMLTDDDNINYYTKTATPRPTYFAPLMPTLFNPSNIEHVLDYYLKYEKYRADYNNYVNGVNSTAYETDWTNYNAAINTFMIPPFATFSNAAGYFKFENVPVGKRYKIYYSDTPFNSGYELPASFSPLGTAFDAPEDWAGQTITIP